ERARTEEALRLSEQRVRSIIESALDAIVTIDNEGKITGWNPEAVRAFGWSQGEALGQNLADLIIPLESREAQRMGLQRLRETGENRLEMLALRKKGATFPAEITISKLDSSQGMEFSAFIRDL